MPSPPEDFRRALRRRDPLRADGRTDALRLLDGAGDGAAFAGLYLDDFAGRWLVGTERAGQSPPEWLRGLAVPAGGSGPDAPRSIYWKRLDPRGEHQQPPAHWAGEAVAEPFAVRENGLRYRVDFAGGYSQGLFLDQRDNRAELRRRVGAGGVVLNTFAYTCAFSVAAAAAGARTVSVDLSRRSLDWGKENFRLNGLAEEGHEFHAGDVFERLRRFERQGRRFAGVVLDPPTFSRDRQGKVFRVGDDFGELVRRAAPLLEPSGWLLCSTNSQGLTASDFRRMIHANIAGGEEVQWSLDTPSLPLDFTARHVLWSVWCMQRPEETAAI